MMEEPTVSPRRFECANPGCEHLSDPGGATHPYCSSSCRTNHRERQSERIEVRALKAGQYVQHPAKGGGFVRRRCEVDGVLIRQGDTPIFVPATSLCRELARIGYKPAPAKATNGHG